MWRKACICLLKDRVSLQDGEKDSQIGTNHHQKGSHDAVPEKTVNKATVMGVRTGKLEK